MKFPKFLQYLSIQSNVYDVNSASSSQKFPALKKPKESLMKCRYVVILLAAAVQFNFATIRNPVGLAIVTMVNHSALHKDEIVYNACPNLVTNTSHFGESSVDGDGEFTWSPKLQGYVLGSSQLLFVLALPFVGILTDVVGCKNVLFYGTLLSALLTVLSPFAAWCHVYLFIAVQGLRGLFQAGFFPALAALMANWCPISERGFSQTLHFCALSFGSAISNTITGVLCKTTLLRGWPLAFFISGGFGLLTAIFLKRFLYDSPSDHPKIPEEELKYILENQENVLTKKREKTPWHSLFTSVPVYALACASFGNGWTVAHFMSLHSIFLGTMMHYPIHQPTLEQWHKIIYISIVVAMSCASIFCIFGSADVQPWNDVKEENTIERKPDLYSEIENETISVTTGSNFGGGKNQPSTILKVL